MNNHPCQKKSHHHRLPDFLSSCCKNAVQTLQTQVTTVMEWTPTSPNGIVQQKYGVNPPT